MTVLSRIRAALSRPDTRPTRKAAWRSRQALMQSLEGRTLMSAFMPTVFTDGGAGSGSLRAAVIAANADAGTDDAVINLGAGTYSLSLSNVGGVQENGAATGDLDVTNTAHKLIIRGATDPSGAPATTIDAGSLADRVFEVVTPGTRVEFHNLVITGGLARDNGAAGAAPQTDGSPVGPGRAEGGGVLNGGGNLAFTNVVFDANTAQGAPHYASRSADWVDTNGDRILQGNEVVEVWHLSDGEDARGGAVYSSGGTVTFDDSTFSNNAARGGDGPDYQTIYYPTATSIAGAAQGGGLYAAAGQVLVTDTTFVSNRAVGGRNVQYYSGNDGRAGAGQGGGIFSTAALTLTNSTFAANAAQGGDEGEFFAGEFGYWTWHGGTPSSGYGGGLYTGGGSATITATTFAGNSAFGGYGFDGVLGAPLRALGYGGGFLNQGAQVTLVDSILTDNRAGHGGGVGHVWNNQPPPDTTPSGGTEQNVQNSAGSLAGHHNLIRDASGGLGDTIAADPMLAPLSNYGGPTQTLAPLPGSPALGAGAAVAGVTTDQRGVARTGRFDVGAFQSQGFNVAASGGDGQSTYVGTTFAGPLTATVSSAFGEPVAGGRISFAPVPSAAGAAATLSDSVVTIAADGSASVTATANPTAGTHQVTTATGPAIVTAASFALTNTLAPTDLTPATFGDNPFSTSLRGGIIAFNHDPDGATHTMNLASGTYFLTRGELAVTSTAHTLIIRGQGTTGANATVIDADETSRVFRIVNPGTTVQFENLVIRDGLAARGGGVSNDGGNLTFTNVVFDSNTARGADGSGYDWNYYSAPGESGSGGGLYSSAGSISIVDSTFSNNNAVGGKGASGGIELPGGFGGAGRGAGLYSGGGSVTITRTTFDANSAAGGDGGDSFDHGFSGFRRTQGGNGGVARGGGVYAGGGSVVITNSTFASDSVVGGNGGRGSAATTDALAGDGGQGGGAQGGGLYSLGTTTVSGATFSSTAVGGTGGDGGAARDAYPAGQPGLDGAVQGGGLDIGGGSTTLNNSIVAGTTGAEAMTSDAAFYGPAFWDPELSEYANPPGTLVGSHNLIQDGSGGPGLTNTVIGDPLLHPLADNGGPTATMAFQAGSPAIDAGNNDLVPAGVVADQRGLPRRHNDLVDIGAFEDQTAPLTAATTTSTTSSTASSTYGDSVTFTATVTSTAAPTGGVTFVIDGGTPVAGTAGVASGTTATWTYTTSSLAAGSHSVVAVFDGVGFRDSTAALGGGQVVDKATAAVAVGGYDGGTYDGSAHTQTVTATGIDGGQLYATSLTGTDAGSYTQPWSYTNPNYNDVGGTLAFTIAKAASATTTAGAGPFTYDGTVHAGGSGAVTGVGLNTGATSLTYSGDRVNAGTYYVTAHYAGDANHLPSEGAAVAVTIDKAASTVEVIVAGGPFTYSGLAQTPAATVTVTGAGGLNVSGAASYENNVNAGTATASYAYPGDANHEAASGSGTFAIGRADAAVAVDGYGGGTYDGTAHTQTVTVTGVAADGEVYATRLTGTGAGDYSHPWAYSNSNYNAVGGTLAFTIAKAAATFTVTPYSVTYDGTPHAATVSTVTGVNGEAGATVGTVTLGGPHTDAGTYADAWTFQGGANYHDVAATTITNVIEKAALTITADDDAKVYGTVKTFGGTAFTHEGLVAGDEITATTATSAGAAAAAAVGTYDIIPGAATGTGLDNYDITYINGTLTVFPPITVPAAVQTAYEDADAAIGGISIADGLSGSLTLTLAVNHGTLTLGTNAGLTVTGDGSGAVALTGTTADLNAALATLVYRGGLNYSGGDTLSLTLGDGNFSWNAEVAITVVSADQQADDLTADVDELVASGVLTGGQGEALILNLRDNNGDAGKVQAYLNQVTAFLNGGSLTQAQADALLGSGGILLLGVSRR